jgi:serine/threonine-protein kinase
MLISPGGWVWGAGVVSLLGVAATLWWWHRSGPGPRAGSPQGLPAGTPAVEPDAGGPLRPERKTLGRYRIEKPLGRGSMGVVYLAHDLEHGRAVAIKTLALSREFDAADLADARARFFREAEAAARLRHPDIVAVHEAGEDQGLAFIAMEYVRGHDLLRHMTLASLLPVPALLRIAARVALALAHAHTHGVVHRDVKPANVLIDPGTDTVKVADFGIASITDMARTRTGVMLGTPSFMSPEQMAGARIDGRSDLYALGVLLFQGLTGALPHRAESMAELLRQIGFEPAPDVRTLRPELPAALADLLARALSKRPEQRYADGQQMASDLVAIADRLDAPVASAPARALPGPVGTDAFADIVEKTRVDPRHNAEH